MSGPSTTMTVERDGAVATLTLVPPPSKPPTLDAAVLDEFDGALQALEADPPRLLVLKSASPRCFCAGANIEALKRINESTIVDWVERGHEVINRLEDLPFPCIAHVRGHAVGGGLELAMGCDLIFATTDSHFGLPEATLGFIPGWGGCHRLAARIGSSTARYWFFTGRIVDARTARDAGLVDFVGDPDELGREIDDFATATIACSGTAIGLFKKQLNHARRAARDRNAAAEVAGSQQCINDPDGARRLAQFLDRRSRRGCS